MNFGPQPITLNSLFLTYLHNLRSMSISPLPPALSVKMRQVQRLEDKKRQLSANMLEVHKKNIINYNELNKTIDFGIENAINQCKVQ